MSSRGGRNNSWRGRGRREGYRRRGGNNSASSSRTNSRPQNIRPRQVQQPLTPCPYRKWDWYFPDDDYTPGSLLLPKIEAFKSYFEEHSSQFSKDDIERIGSVTLEYEDVVSDIGITTRLPTFANELRENPEKILQGIGLAMYQVLTDIDTEASTSSVFDFPYIQARIINYDCITPLKNLKSNYFGNMFN